MTAQLPPSVVLYVNGSQPNPAPADIGSAFGPDKSPPDIMAAHLARAVPLAQSKTEPATQVQAEPARLDPHAVHRDFPARWQAYILAHFRGIGHIVQAFGVSERTARKWMAGETGCNGGHVAVAVRTHPVEAPAMLFAAE